MRSSVKLQRSIGTGRTTIHSFRRLFKIELPVEKRPRWGDLLALLVVIVLLYLGVQVAVTSPSVVQGPEISLEPRVLPLYALFSLGRMAAAYGLSMIFSLVYGRWAANSRTSEMFLVPLLDVLQSVPILSFLPVILLSLSTVLPERLAAEVASIILIFTSQAWNLTFAWYQSLSTIPKELREASAIYRFGSWMRFKTLELSFAAIALVWNSMMSWAGGWFYLMAAEMFTVGQRDFRLLGLGAYLSEAANRGDLTAIAWGVGVLILVIVGLDQLVWRPLLTWADRFKLEMVGGSENDLNSWFYNFLRDSRILGGIREAVTTPLGERLDQRMVRLFPPSAQNNQPVHTRLWINLLAGGAAGLGLVFGADRALVLLRSVPPGEWAQIGIGLLATLLRVVVALGIALAWTIPVGVAIGTNRRLAAILQPVVQITASVPATALFPAFLLLVADLPAGVNIAAVVLMLMGTQWYLLFNIIAGAAAIPQDLKFTAVMLGLSRAERWRTLTLPALFPYIVTGAITASGGAWNASIVAEHVQFAGKTLETTGIGALIAQATGEGNYPLLLASTLTLVLFVVLINRFFWRRLYRLAEGQYRME